MERDVGRLPNNGIFLLLCHSFMLCMYISDVNVVYRRNKCQISLNVQGCVYFSSELCQRLVFYCHSDIAYYAQLSSLSIYFIIVTADENSYVPYSMCTTKNKKLSINCLTQANMEMSCRRSVTVIRLYGIVGILLISVKTDLN